MRAILIASIGKRRHVEEPVVDPKSTANSVRRPELPPSLQPGLSNVLQALKSKSKDPSNGATVGTPIDYSAPSGASRRDSETLTIIENLEIGPYDYAPSDQDPTFSTIDPHSSIRLS